MPRVKIPDVAPLRGHLKAALDALGPKAAAAFTVAEQAGEVVAFRAWTEAVALELPLAGATLEGGPLLAPLGTFAALVADEVAENLCVEDDGDGTLGMRFSGDGGAAVIVHPDRRWNKDAWWPSPFDPDATACVAGPAPAFGDVEPFRATTTSRYHLSLLTVEVGPHNVQFVATDGKRLAASSVRNLSMRPLNGTSAALLHAPAAALFASFAAIDPWGMGGIAQVAVGTKGGSSKPNSTINLSLSGLDYANLVTFTFEGSSARIWSYARGDWPNWRQALPDPDAARIDMSFEASGLWSEVDRINSLTSNIDYPTVRWTVEGGHLRIMVKETGQVEATSRAIPVLDIVPQNVDRLPKKLVLAYDLSLVVPALRRFVDRTDGAHPIVLSFHNIRSDGYGSDGPVTIDLNLDHQRVFYLIMPSEID